MQIVELDESSLQCVAAKTTFSPKSSGVRLLRVRLPNGGIAEFETCSPERSVAMILQAIRGSALAHLWNDANGKRGVCKHVFSRKTSSMHKKSCVFNVN